MYRIVLSCLGAPEEYGHQAAAEITREFREQRPWHQDVLCEWNSGILTLTAVNDFDTEGKALSDEFSDLISAYTPPILKGISP